MCYSLWYNAPTMLPAFGMVGAWHGHGMAIVNQKRPHCINQMRKTHSKPLAARHGKGTAWARHENGMLCVNRPLMSSSGKQAFDFLQQYRNLQFDTQSINFIFVTVHCSG